MEISRSRLCGVLAGFLDGRRVFLTALGCLGIAIWWVVAAL